MRFRLLACDYDRTIAVEGVVGEVARQALRAVRGSGRALVLVTGRTEAELADVFDDPALFDRVVVENGAVLQRPGSRTERRLCAAVPGELLTELRHRGVRPLVVGRSIVSTSSNNEPAVKAALHALRLRRDVVLNRDSVMVMAPGCGKASGLTAAAEDLGVPMAETVAVGDGENDLALLEAAGVGVAVENAVDQLKRRADIVLRRPGSAGIHDLCASLVQFDLEDLLEASPAPR